MAGLDLSYRFLCHAPRCVACGDIYLDCMICCNLLKVLGVLKLRVQNNRIF